jgi:hypothetical protein
MSPRRRARLLWFGAIACIGLAVASVVVVRVGWPGPGGHYLRVSIDGKKAECFWASSPATALSKALPTDPLRKPVVIVYDRPAQPVFSSVGFAAGVDVVWVLPDTTVFGGTPLRLPPGVPYRQPIKPIGWAVVYPASKAPPTPHMVSVGGSCAGDPPGPVLN